MFRRKERLILEVSTTELRLIRDSLFRLREKLIAEGRYTDAIDELLVKLVG